VSRNDYLDDSEDMPDDEGIPDFPEADIPDFSEEDSPADSCMSDSLPSITLCVIPWQSKTRPASELHARLGHGQDDVPGGWSGSE